MRDLSSSRLPAVSFIKFTGTYNEHPANTDPLRGQKHLADLVKAIMDSPYWARYRHHYHL